MAYHVGLDVGLRSSSVCIIDDQGGVRLEREVPSEIEPIATCVGSVDGEIEGVALETGNLTPWLAAGLRAQGFRVVVMEARQVRTSLSSMRNKTDRNDARGIDPSDPAIVAVRPCGRGTREKAVNVCCAFERVRKQGIPTRSDQCLWRRRLRRDADHEKKRDPHRMKRNDTSKRSLTSMPD
jgi:hypothetical protein